MCAEARCENAWTHLASRSGRAVLCSHWTLGARRPESRRAGVGQQEGVNADTGAETGRGSASVPVGVRPLSERDQRIKSKTLTGGSPPAVVYFIRLSDAPEAAGERAEIVFVEYLEKVHDALRLIGRPGHEEVFSCSRK